MGYKAISSTQIYLDLRKLLDKILDITPNFPRAYKFTIGDKMQNIMVEMISDISAAYLNRDKAIRLQLLSKFQANFETLKMLIRVAGERRWISGKSIHAEIVELIVSIGKQSTAWIRSLTESRAAKPGS